MSAPYYVCVYYLSIYVHHEKSDMSKLSVEKVTTKIEKRIAIFAQVFNLQKSLYFPQEFDQKKSTFDMKVGSNPLPPLPSPPPYAHPCIKHKLGELMTSDSDNTWQDTRSNMDRSHNMFIVMSRDSLRKKEDENKRYGNSRSLYVMFCQRKEMNLVFVIFRVTAESVWGFLAGKCWMVLNLFELFLLLLLSFMIFERWFYCS